MAHDIFVRPGVWIVEDDPGLQFVYREILSAMYDVSVYDSLTGFRAALRETERPRPHLVIADLRLPNGSFLGFLESEDAHGLASLSFLVVSSLDDLHALRLCFARGALDYITKPFGKAELLVKVQRILASERKPPHSFSVDPTALTVTFLGKASPILTPKEFQIMAVLNEASEQRLTRDEIRSRVWGNIFVTAKTLDVHIFNLRKKLAPIGLVLVHVPPHYYQLSTQDK